MADDATAVLDEPLADSSVTDVSAPETPVVETDTTTQVEAPVSITPEAPVEQFNWRESLKQAGVPLDAQDDQSAVQALANLYQRMIPLAQTGYQMQPQMAEFRAWQQAQAAQRQQPQAQIPQQSPAQAAASKKWEALKYDKAWEDQVAYDAQGRPIPKDPYNVDAVKNLQDYQRQLKERLQAIATDPSEVFNPYFEERFEQEFERRMGAERERQQQQQFAASAIGQYAPMLYAQDQTGNRMQDPITGQPVLTQFGQTYAQHVQQFAQQGITDPRMQHTLAIGMAMEPYLLAQQQAKAQPAATTAATPQAAFMDRVNPPNRQPNRTGTMRQALDTEEPQNPADSLFQQMRKLAVSQGVI